METTLQQRTLQYNRHVSSLAPGAFSSCLGGSAGALRALIRPVLLEEIQRLRLPQDAPLASLAEVAKNEVLQATQEYPVTDAPPRFDESPTNVYPVADAPTRLDERPTHAYVARQAAAYGPINPTPVVSQVRPYRVPVQPVTFVPRPRKSDLWRTPERRPIYYHCGEAGHLHRACPYRRVGLRGFEPDARCPQNGERPREIEQHLWAHENPAYSGRCESRSLSPRRYCSLSPGRPTSFAGRRS